MKFKIFLLGLLTCFIGFAALAQKNAKLTALMHSFYGSLLTMKPYMISFDEFQKPENKPKVLGMLKDLEKQVQSTNVHALKAPGFNLTYDLFGKHLRDTTYLYEKEIYQTAWNNLRAINQFCVACHDRLPKGAGRLSWPSDLEVTSTDPATLLREADFFYIGHQFSRAMEIYEKVVREYKSKSKSPNILEEAYQRKIAYFARIQRDPGAAIANLKEDLKNSELPLETKKNLEEWTHYFEAWKKEGKKDPALLSDQGLVNYTREIVEKSTGGRRITVSDPYTVNLLRVSGLLYERVFKQTKSPQVQEMLYLLAKCERDLAPIRNYSLADVYYKECILQDPQKPVAKKCFSEYELAMKQRYRNGASEYVEAGLEELRKMTQ